MSIPATRPHLRPIPRNKPRNKPSKFRGLADLSMEDWRKFIAEYRPWSSASINASRSTHRAPALVNDPTEQPSSVPLPRFEPDRTFTGFSVRTPKTRGRGAAPAKRYSAKDDLWWARSRASLFLARQIYQAALRGKRAGAEPTEVITLIADRLRLPEDTVERCIDNCEDAVPDLIASICGESIKEKALKRHQRLFFQLRPWLRKRARPDTGFDDSWRFPQVSYLWPYTWNDDYRNDVDRYFEDLVRIFLKKTVKKAE